MGSNVLNKLEAADALAEYVELMCKIEEAFPGVGVRFKILRDKLNAFREAPAMPVLERILAAMEIFYAEGTADSARYAEAEAVLSELRQAERGNSHSPEIGGMNEQT